MKTAYRKSREYVKIDNEGTGVWAVPVSGGAEQSIMEHAVATALHPGARSA
jgi:hypothetical protein